MTPALGLPSGGRSCVSAPAGACSGSRERSGRSRPGEQRARPPSLPPAPTWVGDGHRGLGVAAELGAVPGVQEVDGELLELAAVQEAVELRQLQQRHLHLLPALPGLEEQLTLREDVVLGEKGGGCYSCVLPSSPSGFPLASQCPQLKRQPVPSALGTGALSAPWGCRGTSALC